MRPWPLGKALNGADVGECPGASLDLGASFLVGMSRGTTGSLKTSGEMSPSLCSTNISIRRPNLLCLVTLSLSLSSLVMHFDLSP